MAVRNGGPQVVDVLAGLGIHDKHFIVKRAVQGHQLPCRGIAGEIRLGKYDERSDVFQLGESQQLIERQQARRRIGQRGHRDHGVDVGRHRFGAALNRTALERERARIQAVDQRPPVFQHAHVHAVPGREHLAFSGRSFEVGDSRLLFVVQHDVRGIFADGNDACRERLAHAANDVRIVDWARTLRIDAPPSEAVWDRVAALARDGVRVHRSDSHGASRSYALIEGPEGVDPVQLEQNVPDGRWYDSAIIALAIEPLPADALPALAQALGGPGAPAGVCDCAVDAARLIIEFRPEVTPPGLLLRIIDVELRRYGASRRTELLTPLSVRTAAAIAAQGLQAPEIASDRILESLLGLEHVE